MPRKYRTKSFQLCRCCYKWRCQCLVLREEKPHPPFNSGVKPGSKLGLHPKLMAFVPMTTSPDVGSYDPRPIVHKSLIISWRRQQEVEEFSAVMGGRLTKEVVDQKSLMKIGRGPGSYEIPRWPESATDKPCKSLRTDTAFGTVPRFQTSCKSTTPGPGYTLRTHNPFFYLDQKRLKGFSHVPSFEYDNLVPRFRETTKTWSLPCTSLQYCKRIELHNRYNVKHPSSLQVFLEKVTGKKGPYDLFTGPRNETTVKGYWAREKLKDRDDWPRKLPGEMEKLSSRYNYFRGRWSTNPRFTKKPVTRMMLRDISTCYKNPDEPGPGQYNPGMLQKPSSLKRYPFDSNIEYVRPLPPSDIHPGPARYKIKQECRVKGHGWTCVFKSKVPRTISVLVPLLYRDY